ncbi:MAG TPA: SAM-dependent methyltransferase [Hyphomonadaceae bacterium]|nr:SAM-dependent methyltransferase [Hyphomonadaceae bacterium]
MEPGKPSRTAMAAAGHRMIHQLVDRPLAFADPLAIAILGPAPPNAPGIDAIRAHADATRLLRAQIVGRSLFAEETLARAVARGVDQYVLLGAGLDTFAYRNPYPQLHIFEVDNPDSGRWKQERLALNTIPVPANVSFVAIDFEHETLRDALARGGFDLQKPAVFAWLGVTVYLTREAILKTLKAVASLAEGTEIVFDYGEPRDALPAEVQARMQERMAALAAIGEPWISFFRPVEMAALLNEAGFSETEDLDGNAINLRWFSGRADGLATTRLSHYVRAKV